MFHSKMLTGLKRAEDRNIVCFCACVRICVISVFLFFFVFIVRQCAECCGSSVSYLFIFFFFFVFFVNVQNAAVHLISLETYLTLNQSSACWSSWEKKVRAFDSPRSPGKRFNANTNAFTTLFPAELLKHTVYIFLNFQEQASNARLCIHLSDIRQTVF